MGARSIDDDNLFRGASETFDGLTTKLATQHVLEMDHAKVEKLLEQERRELLRQLFQDHLDLRGGGSAVGTVIGSDDVQRTHHRVRSRPLGTLFGSVAVIRS